MAWDAHTLLTHLNARIDVLEKAMLTGFASQREAIAKAEAATDRRLEGMNEFRQTLTDQTATYVPRGELDQRFAALEKAIDQVEASITVSSGRSLGLSQSWGYFVGVVGMLLAVASVALSAWTIWRR